MEYQKTSGVFKITGEWEQQAKQIQTRFPLLTDEDMKFEPGKENELIFRISKRLRKKKEVIVNLILNYQNSAT